MRASEVLLLDYGAGNVRSAAKALERAGMTVRVSGDPADVPHAPALVVPGQGHFRQVMEAFDRRGFHGPVLDAAKGGTPILGICVGMQMLLTGSEEAPGTPGLNLIPGTVRRFTPVPGRKVPQMGWNSLDKVGDSPLLRGLACPAYAYFVHSYYVPLDVEVDAGAITEYGVPFWAALSRGNMHATQFHPEKSGAVGLAILERFRRHVLEERED
ncbi:MULTISPECIES: imidazole glycerol phosphate synthase subunit HisH [Deinococcus]|uniref:Imidazole glycerol phosphate synthase subunit HisH n=1 Tax=Deinococcus geothermalis (strain DSM 11300 / CIP 105573 / AG-3a) TaxID=319795 RepID=Q1IZQ4_DEIGD|nr:MULTISPECIES: imidazole glycerol phosphate synthase subunit HisH [Deinococcus]ABF45280.1 imidazole glycerol phosphate synthase, glutamine amidotransferase subunit [Deinococcus geothermalis DSM 11300]TDE86723.1 imidazole glycerol phosphate synthase subunit HisH [Deinococcus sp. S9]